MDIDNIINDATRDGGSGGAVARTITCVSNHQTCYAHRKNN